VLTRQQVALLGLNPTLTLVANSSRPSETGVAHEANSVLSLLALASDGGVLKRDTTVLDNTLRGDLGHGFLFDRIPR